MVHDTARGADHYMYAALQLSQLARMSRAAVNRQHVKTRQVARIFLEGLGYLDCQFPRGCGTSTWGSFCLRSSRAR